MEKIKNFLLKKEVVIGSFVLVGLGIITLQTLIIYDNNSNVVRLKTMNQTRSYGEMGRNRIRNNSVIDQDYEINFDIGADKASTDTTLTLEEMLTYAVEDEYLAQAEYKYIIDTFGNMNPFSNIIEAEGKHIALLEPLLNEYELVIEDKTANVIIKPKTIEEALKLGIEAEVKNIKMYQTFLDEELPDNVRSIFIDLLDASENHLSAFTKKLSRY